MARLVPWVLLLALLSVPLVAVTAVISSSPSSGYQGAEPRLKLSTQAPSYQGGEPVDFTVANAGETSFHGRVELLILQGGGCQVRSTSYTGCAHVAILDLGHIDLEPGASWTDPVLWKQITGRGESAPRGTYTAGLRIHDVSAQRIAGDDATFELTGEPAPTPTAGILDLVEGGTYTRTLPVHLFAGAASGLSWVTVSLTTPDGADLFPPWHRDKAQLPKDNTTFSWRLTQTVDELEHTGPAWLSLHGEDRDGQSFEVTRTVTLGQRAAAWNATQNVFGPGQNVTFQVENTGTVTLEGPSRWNVSGHRVDGVEGWAHQVETHRFEPLASGESRTLVWDGRLSDGSQAPAGEYEAYLALRGFVGGATFTLGGEPRVTTPTPPDGSSEDGANQTAADHPNPRHRHPSNGSAADETPGLGAQISAEIDLRGKAPWVSIDGPVAVTDITVTDDRVSMRVSSSQPSGQLVTIQLPNGTLSQGDFNLTLDGEPVASVSQAADLLRLSTGGDEPLWVRLETGQGQVLVVWIDHFSTRELVVEAADGGHELAAWVVYALAAVAILSSALVVGAAVERG